VVTGCGQVAAGGRLGEGGGHAHKSNQELTIGENYSHKFRTKISKRKLDKMDKHRSIQGRFQVQVNEDLHNTKLFQLKYLDTKISLSACDGGISVPSVCMIVLQRVRPFLFIYFFTDFTMV